MIGALLPTCTSLPRLGPGGEFGVVCAGFEWMSTASLLLGNSRNTNIITVSGLGLWLGPEADLGMFGPTGAPTKKGPNKRTGTFLQHSNMPEIMG